MKRSTKFWTAVFVIVLAAINIRMYFNQDTQQNSFDLNLFYFFVCCLDVLLLVFSLMIFVPIFNRWLDGED